MKSLTLILVATLLALSGCGSKDSQSDLGSQGGAQVDNSMQGLWLQKNEANELRSTGKLESLCEEIRKEPNVKIVNMRLIDADGSNYLYIPQVGKRPETKIGTVDASGKYTPVDSHKDKVGDGEVTAKLVDGELVFTYFFRNFGNVTNSYLKSSEEEAVRYYAAQEACK